MTGRKTFEYTSVLRGYHEYITVWKADIGHRFTCRQEPTNEHDKFAVAAWRDDRIVGHVPKTKAKIFFYFLNRGGTICGKIIGKRQNNGCGLELPCVYTFVGNDCDMDKLKKLMK